MDKFCRISRKLIIPMAILMPLWLLVGRPLLGSMGWLTIIYAFTVVPILFITLLTFRFYIPYDTQDGRKQVRPLYAKLLVGLYVSIFLHGLFLVDYGDTDESIDSVASNIIGDSFHDISSILSGFFFTTALLLIIAIFIIATRERLKRRAVKA